MNISRLFIVRPVATALLMIALVLVGLVSVGFLPVSSLPDVDYPTIQVQTFYPGASPQVMSTTVTAPLEVQLGQIPGLQQMISSSSSTASIITLQFDLSINLDVAEQNVQEAINAANSLLPSGLPAPPTYAKVNPADQPILTLAVTSKAMSLTQLQDIANNRLASKIAEVPGVGLVSPSGGNVPAIRVEADPQKLAAYGLNIDDLRTLLANITLSQPKGNFDGPELDYTINDNDQISDPQDYLDTVISYQNGSPVLLRDVATVSQAAQNIEQGAWFNGTPAIVLNVQRQPGANVIKTVNQIKQQLPQLLASLPPSMHVDIVADSTGVIRSSVDDAFFELVLAIGLVVLVIFVFLRNLPATIIPSISVPVSLIGTLAVMYKLGYSIDNLSLMALIIATGFVVDDSIVMIENIVRYLEEGMPPLDAALTGAGQIGFTILSLTVSLIAVLIPLLFMGGVIGRLFSEFAVTLAITIVLSGVVSLTLVPMLCARMLRRQAGAPSKPLRAHQRRPVQQDAGRLRARPALGAAPSGADPARRGRHRGADGRPLRRHSEGTVSRAGCRRHPGHQRRRQLGLLPGDGGAADGTGRRHPERRRRHQPDLVCRHRRHQQDPEQRPLPDQSQGGRRPLAERRADRPAHSAAKSRTFQASSSTCNPNRT